VHNRYAAFWKHPLEQSRESAAANLDLGAGGSRAAGVWPDVPKLGQQGGQAAIDQAWFERGDICAWTIDIDHVLPVVLQPRPAGRPTDVQAQKSRA
jgi:hypothetical protein